MRCAPNMDKPHIAILGGAIVGTAAVALLITYLVSSSNAEDKSLQFLTASADMARCVGGNDVVLAAQSIELAFHRRLVSELPDISTAGDCDQALETVTQKYADYQGTWFNALGSKADDGRALGEHIQTAMSSLKEIPYSTPSDRFLRKKKLDHPILKLPALSFALYQAAEKAASKEGASAKRVESARETRLREARKGPRKVQPPQKLFSIPGRVKPERWSILPADKTHLMMSVQSEREMLLAWSDNGAQWKTAAGLRDFAGKPNATFGGLWAPNHERWLLVSYNDGSKPVLGTAKVASDAAALPTPTMIPDPPSGWERPSDAHQEVAVLPSGVLAFAVTKVIEKTPDDKRDEDKRKKEWEKNYADKEVQLQMTLESARVDYRKKTGIDEEHKRLDGVAYAIPNQMEIPVVELPGHALAALIPGPEPMVLLGKDELPTYELNLGLLPGPAAGLGQLTPSSANKPVKPLYRGSPWFRCMAADGWKYGMSERGAHLLGMRPGSLDIVPMTAQAAENSHLGCGLGATIVALPFEKDRIFVNILTIRNNEIEGAKVATTAGTHVEEFNDTVSMGVVPGAVMVAWVTEGFVQHAISKNWGTEYLAPELLAEAGVDGSKIASVRLVGIGDRLLAIFAREQCSPTECTTTFEAIASDDAGKSWKAP